MFGNHLTGAPLPAVAAAERLSPPRSPLSPERGLSCPSSVRKVGETSALHTRSVIEVKAQ